MKVLVYIEQRDGKIRPSSLEALSAAAEFGSEIDAVVIGHDVATDELQKLNIKKCHHVNHDSLKLYNPESYGQALTTVASQCGAKVVLGVATPLSRDLLAYVSGKNSWAAATDLISVKKVDDGTITGQKPLFAGKAIAQIEIKVNDVAVVLLRPNTFSAPDASGSCEVIQVDFSGASAHVECLGHQASEQTKADLTEAKYIISGGVSLGSKEKFSMIEECADVIGASVGASRAAVNEGYASHDMQVGQTGKTVSPELYIACGISGAIQHMAGMRTSKTIVAINKDADAAIFSIADFGLVGDMFEIVPLLTSKLKEVM